MRIFFFIVWALAALLLTACGSSPEQTVDTSPQRVRTTSYVWTTPSEIRRAKPAARAQKIIMPTSGRVSRYSSAGWFSVRSGDYADYPGAARLIEKLVREESFKRSDPEQVLARVERRQRILNLVSRLRAKWSTGPTGAWSRYRAKFLTSDNISNGIGFWHRYGNAL